jgi:hypothetical protein
MMPLPRNRLPDDAQEEKLLKRHWLEVEKRPTALRPPELDASEVLHGNAPGESRQGHNSCTDNRISPVR